jgi:hypothetical protein
MAKEILLKCNVCGFMICTKGYEKNNAKAMLRANRQHNRDARCGFNMHKVEVIETGGM